MNGEFCVFSPENRKVSFYGMLVALGRKISICSELQVLKRNVQVHQMKVMVDLWTFLEYGEMILQQFSDKGQRKKIGIICSSGEWGNECEGMLYGCEVVVIRNDEGREKFISECEEMLGMECHATEAGIQRGWLYRKGGAARYGELDAFLGVSPAWDRLLAEVKQYAGNRVPLLLTGEPGVGKSFLAKLIAREYGLQRKRRTAEKCGHCAEPPFIRCPVVNYSADTMESRLFGHVRGSFTGAISDYEGKIAAAAGGTLFIDEVADIPPDIQPKLLDFLQEGTYSPLGSNEVKQSDARIISATNRNLAVCLNSGQLRRDFLERIAGKIIKIPSLEERLEDIPYLAVHFLNKMNAETGCNRILSDSAINRMLEMSWKDSNVRGLEKLIQRMVYERNSVMLTAADVEACDQSNFFLFP